MLVLAWYLSGRYRCCVTAAPFFVRPTSEDDWQHLRDLRIENATDNPISFGATLETTLGLAEDDWRARARRGQSDDAASMVAIQNGTERWIGIMSAQSSDEDGLDPVLTGVYVSPDFRGRSYGVADALLHEILTWAAGRGDSLRLYVYEHGTPARRFYDRHGFAPTGRTRPLGFTEGRTLEMIKPLR